MIIRKAPFTIAVLIAAALLFMSSHARAAFETAEREGVTIYYPGGEEEIASRLLKKTPEILSFLKQQGLPVTLPLHAVLDGELDRPEVAVAMIPHREIRIPLRAPGVLEDGYLEKDPWAYSYFKGLCLQGIYSLRKGLPALARHVFGEAASPNMILPPWLTDGACSILYEAYCGSSPVDPFRDALFQTSIPDDISRVSNHPGTWPGYHACRIYGIPFMSWVHSRYGWERILQFLSVHGGGVVPVEVDLKAKQVFGRSWPDLWEDFRKKKCSFQEHSGGMTVEGYWPEPFMYWNASGVYPGRKNIRLRGRYGFLDDKERLRLSEYRDQGVSEIVEYRRGIAVKSGNAHVWDPGQGGIAVTRTGSRPCLILYDQTDRDAGIPTKGLPDARKVISGPPGVLQLSGPVMSGRGRIAVSANCAGNWDIWVYDAGWKRVTRLPSVEMDPWWDGETLVFSSDATGIFQVHGQDMSQLAHAERGAVLPRQGSCLILTPSGWMKGRYGNGPGRGSLSGSSGAGAEPSPAGPANTRRGEDSAHPPDARLKEEGTLSMPDRSRPGPSGAPDARNDDCLNVRPYSPLKSILPDFTAPDLYIGPSDVQAGLVTWGRDVSGSYSVRTGFRYSFGLEYLSLQASCRARGLGLSFARYPVSYDPKNAPQTEESRHEIDLSLSPPGPEWLSLSVGRLGFEPLDGPGSRDGEVRCSLSMQKKLALFSPSITFESYSGGRTSAFGALRFAYGTDVILASHIRAGKTWGETEPGHGTFRVGGDIGEGYFTRRSSRLFPLRGFAANILEADRAVTSSAEVYFPLADLQMGHKTLPLFLHRLILGTFVDAGVCSEKISADRIMAGAGFELITSMEIAWGNLSAFKIGVAWPVAQPDLLDEKGPVLILQIGKPL